MSNLEPEGPLVSPILALPPASDTTLGGHPPAHTVTIVPLLEEHAPDLLLNVGGPQHAFLYKYMPCEPLNDLESLRANIRDICSRKGAFPFAIFSNDPVHLSNQREPGTYESIPATPVGIICFFSMVLEHRTIEIGSVLFGPTLQRTTAATESVYLLMRHAFEDLHYLRVEWKANNLNEPSKRAALRLGFVSEGVFRKHFIIKGRERDTAWFSVTDTEWFEGGGVKWALEKWLMVENFDGVGRQKRKLEEIRESGKEMRENAAEEMLNKLI